MTATIYLDNGATSFPKPPGVWQQMEYFIRQVGCNVNRGSYAQAYQAGSVLLETREQLCRLFGFNRPENVIFTANITASLNYLIKGLLTKGDHVLVSGLEHNAVMRPLVQLGVSYSVIPGNAAGGIEVNSAGLALLKGLIKPNTKAVILSHGSNLCGTIQPLAEIGSFCRTEGLLFLVDTAQTAGLFPIDMEAMHIDALAFTGHKSLLGPQGIGGFLLRQELAEKLEPLIAGGTGSFSDSLEMPRLTPDRFEAGTPNLPGIYGLHGGLAFLQSIGSEKLRVQEERLAHLFIDAIGESGEDGKSLWIQGKKPGQKVRINVAGGTDIRGRAPVISLDFPGRDNGEVAFLLESRYGVLTRCGLHCAPLAHQTLGTFPKGTVRFSIGCFNTPEEILTAAEAVQQIALEQA